MMHSLILPLPLPTVHTFCVWWHSCSPRSLNINAVVIAEYSLMRLCRGRTLIMAVYYERLAELSLLLALPWRGEGGGRGLALLLPGLVEHVDASLLAPVGVGGACEGD